MINGKRVIAVIPARGGSKGLPGKNIADLGGKPLIAWPIDQAKDCDLIDRVIVSTDDDLIAKTAMNAGAETYQREKDQATDTALVIDALRSLYEKLKTEGERADIIVLLQCTSPFRSNDLIKNILEELENKELNSIATFKEVDEPIERMWSISSGLPKPYIKGANPWMPRQQLTTVHALDGVLYAYRPSALPDDATGLLFGDFGYIINDSAMSIDIDTAKDLALARAMLQIEME